MEVMHELTHRRVRADKLRLDTAVIRDARGFAALEEEWDDLYHHSPRATPFQSWAWLYSWWESYGDGYEPCLISVREGGLLVGLIPLMLERRLGFGRLLFVGTGMTDQLDMLAREGREEAVARAGAEALARMDSWEVADLQELRPEAAAWALLRRGWPGPKTHRWQSNCPTTDLKPWDELVESLPKSYRRMVRRSLRRAEEDGMRYELADAAEAGDAAKRLVSLHRESWQGRGIGLEHTTERFAALLEAAARRMTARGLGAISEFRTDNEVVISTFLVFGQDFVGTYLNGVTREARKRYQFSSLCVRDELNVARDIGIPALNHLRGEHTYKMLWSTRIEPNHRLLLARSPAVLACYGAYRTMRSKVDAYVHSEQAPAWVEAPVRWARNVVARYRGAEG